MVVEYRPEKLLADYFNAIDRLLRRYTDSATGRIGEAHSTIVRECPACGGAAIAPRFVKGALQYAGCDTCGTLFQSPVVKRELLVDIYRNSEVSSLGERIRLQTFESRKKVKFAPIYDRYRDILQSGMLLDIGCSWGYFMEYVVEHGKMRVEGIELNVNTARSVAREKNFTVYDRDIREIDGLEGRYDVISCWGTLTHIVAPHEFLVRCRDALKPGGRLLISTPNSEGFEYIIGAAHHTFQLTCPTIFSARGLEALLIRIGFEKPAIIFPGNLDVKIVRSALEKDPCAGKAISPFLLRNILMDNSAEGKRRREGFQSFVTENSLSGL